MWGLIAPWCPRTLKLYVCSKYLARSNSLPNFSIISLCIMQLCKYVFPIGIPLHVPKNGVWRGGGWVRRCGYALGPWKILHTYKQKLSGNFGYMGRSNPWSDLDQMWRVGRYGGCNHVHNIWWLSAKGCRRDERGNSAFSHWLEGIALTTLVTYRVTV